MRPLKLLSGLLLTAVFLAGPVLSYADDDDNDNDERRSRAQCKSEKSDCRKAIKKLEKAAQDGKNSVSAKAKALVREKKLFGNKVTTESRDTWLDNSDAALAAAVTALDAPIADVKTKCAAYDDCLGGSPDPTATPTAGPDPDPAIARGQALFASSCASCHSASGKRNTTLNQINSANMAMGLNNSQLADVVAYLASI